MFVLTLQGRTFATNTAVALRGLFVDQDHDVQCTAVDFFIAAVAQGMFFFLANDIYAYMLTESLQDKLFDIETVMALQGLMADEHWKVRHAAVNFFLAALAAQSMFPY